MHRPPLARARWREGRRQQTCRPAHRAERNRVSVKGHQLRLGLFAAVVALVCVNAVAPWGDAAGRMGATVLQSGVGAAAIICGVVFARRVHGLSRLLAAACRRGLFGLAGRRAGLAVGRRRFRQRCCQSAAIAAYFLSPLFGLAAMVVLVRAAAVWAATRTARCGIPSLTRSSMDCGGCGVLDPGVHRGIG